MKTLTSIVFGACALAMVGVVGAPAEARSDVGVVINPHGVGVSVDNYRHRRSCANYWFRERHPGFCGRYYRDRYYPAYDYRYGHRFYRERHHRDRDDHGHHWRDRW